VSYIKQIIGSFTSETILDSVRGLICVAQTHYCDMRITFPGK